MKKQDDPFDLSRFVQGQARNYEDALTELRAGKKLTHWSWYVLPQIRGLGSSRMSEFYALSGREEAAAYLRHPLLGTRLCECMEALNTHDGLTAVEILGAIDAKKFHSCATLFARVAGPHSPFHAALTKYFGGVEDGATIALLGANA